MMETLLGKALADIANIVSTRWYAGAGAAGLIIVVWTLLKGSAHDDILVGCIGAAMMFFGAGESQSRTFQQSVGIGFKVTRPVRRFGALALLLYTAAALCAVGAVAKAIHLAVA